MPLSILAFLLKALIYILLAILIMILALLFIPYSYSVNGEKYEESFLEGSITWLFGGIKVDFNRPFPGKFKAKLTLFQWIEYPIKARSSPSKEKHKKNTPKAKKNKPHHKSKEKSSFREFLEPDILKSALVSLTKILNHFQPHTLLISARVGFSDPMLTGLLYGLLSQLHFVIQNYSIKIQPVFEEEGLEGRFLIGGRVWIPYLLFTLIRFLLSQPVRSIYIPKIFKKLGKSKGGPQYVS